MKLEHTPEQERSTLTSHREMENNEKGLHTAVDYIVMNEDGEEEE